MAVHPTALVADGAEIGEDVHIGPYCIVGPQVRIGDGCRLHGHVVVDGDTILGEECEVFPFAVLGTKPQDKKLTGGQAPGRLRIGSHNRIREHVTVHGGTSFGTGVTIVGDHNMLLAGCHIGHDTVVGNHVVFTNGAMAAGHTTIQDRAILGAMAGIHQFARVGRMAMVGAGAMLSRDAPPFALVQGDRARLVGVNVIGLKRSNVPAEQVATVKRCFRALFWRSGLLEERLRHAREIAPDDALVQEIVGFVADTRRGVVVPRGRLELGHERELAEN